MPTETYICELCKHTRNTWGMEKHQYICTWCEIRIKRLGFHGGLIPCTPENPSWKHPDFKSKWDPLDPDEDAQIHRIDCDCGWKDSWKKLFPYLFDDGQQIFVSRQGYPTASAWGVDGCKKCWGTGTVLRKRIEE